MSDEADLALLEDEDVEATWEEGEPARAADAGAGRARGRLRRVREASPGARPAGDAGEGAGGEVDGAGAAAAEEDDADALEDDEADKVGAIDAAAPADEGAGVAEDDEPADADAAPAPIDVFDEAQADDGDADVDDEDLDELAEYERVFVEEAGDADEDEEAEEMQEAMSGDEDEAAEELEEVRDIIADRSLHANTQRLLREGKDVAFKRVKPEVKPVGDVVSLMLDRLERRRRRGRAAEEPEHVAMETQEVKALELAVDEPAAEPTLKILKLAVDEPTATQHQRHGQPQETTGRVETAQSPQAPAPLSATDGGAAAQAAGTASGEHAADEPDVAEPPAMEEQVAAGGAPVEPSVATASEQPAGMGAGEEPAAVADAELGATDPDSLPATVLASAPERGAAATDPMASEAAAVAAVDVDTQDVPTVVEARAPTAASGDLFVDDAACESDEDGGNAEDDEEEAEDEEEDGQEYSDMEGFLADDGEEDGDDEAHRQLDLEHARAQADAERRMPTTAPVTAAGARFVPRQTSMPKSRATSILAAALATGAAPQPSLLPTSKPSFHPFEARAAAAAAAVACGDREDVAQELAQGNEDELALEDGGAKEAASVEDGSDEEDYDSEEEHRERFKRQKLLDEINEKENARAMPSLEDDSQEVFGMLHRVNSRSMGAHTRDGAGGAASRPMLLRGGGFSSQGQASQEGSFLNILNSNTRSAVSSRDGTSATKSFVFNRVDPVDPVKTELHGGGRSSSRHALGGRVRQNSARLLPPASAGGSSMSGLFGKLAQRQNSMPAPSNASIGSEGASAPQAAPQQRPGLRPLLSTFGQGRTVYPATL